MTALRERIQDSLWSRRVSRLERPCKGPRRRSMMAWRGRWATVSLLRRYEKPKPGVRRL